MRAKCKGLCFTTYLIPTGTAVLYMCKPSLEDTEDASETLQTATEKPTRHVSPYGFAGTILLQPPVHTVPTYSLYTLTFQTRIAVYLHIKL